MAKVFDTIDLASIKLAPPKVSKAAAGCKTAYIQGAGGMRVSIQTPLMTLPWDISPRKMDENSSVNASLSLSFVGMDDTDPDDDLNKFFKFMGDFDIKIKTLIAAMGGATGKKSEDKVLDGNFRDSIKESSGGDYPPTIQPKIWLSLAEGGSTKCPEDYTMDITVFNLEGEEIGNDELRKGCPAAAIIEPSYVWCSALGVGITWVAKQVVLKPTVKETFGFTLGSSFDHLKEQGPATKKAKTDEDDLDEDNQGNQDNQGNEENEDEENEPSETSVQDSTENGEDF